MIPYPFDKLILKEETARHWRFLCPFHKEENASFTVNKNDPFYLYYRCWSCGVYGSAKKFARLIRNDSNFIQKMTEGLKHCEFNRPTIDWFKRLGPRNYPAIYLLAKHLGVSWETVTKFDVGYYLSGNNLSKEGKFLIPMYDEKGVCGIQERWYEGDVCKKKCQQHSKHGWFVPNEPKVQEKLFICEGWSDTVVMTELGTFALGRFNALATSVDNITVAKFVKYCSIYIVSDTDDVGIRGAKKLQKLIPNSKLIIPVGFKDIRALYLSIGKQNTLNFIRSQLW